MPYALYKTNCIISPKLYKLNLNFLSNLRGLIIYSLLIYLKG